MKLLQRIFLFTSFLVLVFAGYGNGAWVVREDGRILIEDSKGYRWDVTQAEQLGFVPQRFQYGIGKDAFTPLHDGDFSDDRPGSFSNTRIIGITVDEDAHAYSVNRLTHHEIANTTIAGKAITVGY